MSIIKEAMQDVIMESEEELEQAEYCFEVLDKLNSDAEDMQDLLDDLNESRLKRCMKSLDFSGDFDDIMERVKELKGVLEELVNEDLDAVLPGLEQQIDELEAADTEEKE